MPTTNKQRSPIVAFLLNVLFVPAGYVYVGKARLGLIVCVALVLSVCAIFLLSLRFPPGIYVLLVSPSIKLGAMLVVPFGLGVHAALLTRKSRPTLEGAAFWLSIIGLPLALAALAKGTAPFWPYPAFTIPSEAGIPTLLKDDVVVAQGAKGNCGSINPQRGDILVYRKGNASYIKRLIGLPGDTLRLTQGVLFINDRAVPQMLQGRASINIGGFPAQAESLREALPNGKTYSIYLTDRTQPPENTPAYKIGPGQYFMLGDNRDNSLDSRFQGPTSKSQLCSVAIEIVESRDPSHIGQRP